MAIVQSSRYNRHRKISYDDLNRGIIVLNNWITLNNDNDNNNSNKLIYRCLFNFYAFKHCGYDIDPCYVSYDECFDTISIGFATDKFDAKYYTYLIKEYWDEDLHEKEFIENSNHLWKGWSFNMTKYMKQKNINCNYNHNKTDEFENNDNDNN